MNKVEIVITTPEQAFQDFADTWRKAEAGVAIIPSIGFGSPAELFVAITDKRLELLRFVAQHEEGLNIHQLSKQIGRDYKNVHTDVKALEELGLLQREKGLLVAPFDEIDIKVNLRKAA